MRCEVCVLEEPGGAGLAVDAFLDRLVACTECPLLAEGKAPEPVRLLVRRHHEAARLVHRLESRVRKQQGEIQELYAETEKQDARVAKLESLQQASTRELQEQIALAQRQEAALRALSTPILRVWEDVLALPVIGALDRARAEAMMASLLDEIQARGARWAIVDLTGVGDVDAATADHLLRIFHAARLLGAELILTGMRGRVAQALVDLGVDLSAVRAVGSVEEALRACMRAARG